MVSPKRGAGKVGCLVWFLLAVTLVYFGMNVGEVFLRNYRYVDAMKQEVRFGSTKSDDAIRRRLSSLADSLGLPPEAGRVSVLRRGSSLTVSAEYYVHVELPLFVREFHFVPTATSGS